MEKIILIKPSHQNEREVMEYREEFVSSGEVVHGSGSLDNNDSFEDWLQMCADNEAEATTPEGWVPATQYLAIRESDGKLVGMIQVRHTLNEYLSREGGHIGYSVRKSERRKGYATQMLAAALEKCAELNIERVLVTCDADNLGSAAVIKANGGEFEYRIESQDGGMLDRYWISIPKRNFMSSSK